MICEKNEHWRDTNLSLHIIMRGKKAFLYHAIQVNECECQ